MSVGASSHASCIALLWLCWCLTASGDSNSLYQVAVDAQKEKCDKLAASGQTDTLAFRLGCSPLPASPPPAAPLSGPAPGTLPPPNLPSASPTPNLPSASPPPNLPSTSPSVAPSPGPPPKSAEPPIPPIPAPIRPPPAPGISPALAPVVPTPTAPGPLNAPVPAPLSSGPPPPPPPPVCTLSSGTTVNVNNPSFTEDTGSYFGPDGPQSPAGWSVKIAEDGDNYHYGGGAFSFGAVGTDYDTVSQTLSVNPACRYSVSYYLSNDADGQIFPAVNGNVLRDSDGNSLEIDADNPGVREQTAYVGYFTATGSSVLLSFGGINNPSYTRLQTIAVTVA